MRASSDRFLYLSGAAFLSLWVLMYFNGTLDELGKARDTGMFPSGRTLRTKYTDYEIVDFGITTFMSFFDCVANGRAAGPRLLFADLCAVLHCANVWALVDTRRRGVRTQWMRHPALWTFAWSTFGAATVLPLYCYCILSSGALKRDHTIPLNEAKALPLSSFVGSFYPLLMFAPAILNWGPEMEQLYMAHYMWVTTLGYVTVLAIGSLHPWAPTNKDPKNPDIEQSYVFASYILAGVYGALVHLYTLSAEYVSGDPDLSWTRLFVPAPLSVHAGTPNLIVEGAHLFSQFDWALTTAACMAFAYLQVQTSSKAPGRDVWTLDGFSWLNEKSAVGLIGLSTAVFGPGATGSFALAFREHSLREHSAASKVRQHYD